MASTVKYISPLQFITMDESPYTHLQQVAMACEAGADWIQLRMKQIADDDFVQVATEAKKICDSYNSKLIINDRVHIVKTVGAYGVHIGKEDMPVNEARAILGDEMIVGGTANTADDIEKHYWNGADYIGLGPYRFTTTKKKLSPVLGLEGYAAIMRSLKLKQVELPVVAIGGIQLPDVEALVQAGVHGVAFSGLLVHAENRREVYDSLQDGLLKISGEEGE
ncbi:MAG: thiamine phosphate synthase [Chitinophagaceae bacterium]